MACLPQPPPEPSWGRSSSYLPIRLSFLERLVRLCQRAPAGCQCPGPLSSPRPAQLTSSSVAPCLPQTRIWSPARACPILSHPTPPLPTLCHGSALQPLPRRSPVPWPQSCTPGTLCAFVHPVPCPEHLPFLIPPSAPPNLFISCLGFPKKHSPSPLATTRAIRLALCAPLANLSTHVCLCLASPSQPPVPKKVPGSPTPVASMCPALLTPPGCGHLSPACPSLPCAPTQDHSKGISGTAHQPVSHASPCTQPRCSDRGQLCLLESSSSGVSPSPSSSMGGKGRGGGL